MIVLDARSGRAFNDSDSLAARAVRIDPNRPAEYVTKQGVPRDARVIAFCACPNDRTSMHFADELRQAGWLRARALTGGWEAWQAAGLPVEAKGGG